MAKEKQLHLQESLKTHKMSHIDNLISKYKTKRDEIKLSLKEHYSDNIYNPFDSGSFSKHTAINIKFDLDLVAPFKRNSFDTIQSMFDDVFNFLEKKYAQAGIAHVRKQKVSIGVQFHADKDGHKINIDVVPGRELTIDNFSETKNLNIYFNDNEWGFSKGSYTQTNIQAQIDHIKGKENARKIIRLLKIWKNSNYESYKSFLLELATIKAFDKKDITGNLWEQLKSVMEYLIDNITQESFKIIDPGNSNNDVLSSMESWDKTNFANKLKLMIERIEENSDNINVYFPINNEFKEDGNASGDSKYGLKNGITPSIPPNNQRFGEFLRNR